MPNFPVIAGTGPALQDALVNKVQVTPTVQGGGQFAKYGSYDGDWVFGRENEDLNGLEVTLITSSFSHGWHRWVDRDVTKSMASFLQPLPDKLPPMEDRRGNMQYAGEARGVQFILLGETDDEAAIQITWEGATDGCRRCLDGVLEQTMARAQTEAEFLFPVVVLGHDTPYENKHKDGEMIYPPKMDIVGWRNQAGELAEETEALAAPAKEQEAETPAEAEAKGDPELEPKEASKEADAAEKPAEDAPRRRRRRSAA
jgi:hypothetical protein